MRMVLLAVTLPWIAACEGEPAAAGSPPQAATRPSALPAPSETVLEDVDAAGAAALIERESGVVVLDVRTPKEYAEGHLAGAVNIDFRAEDFAVKLAELERDTTYLVHCRSGGRSRSSLPTFTELGFKSIYHLDGGILAWQEAGKPIEN